MVVVEMMRVSRSPVARCRFSPQQLGAWLIARAIADLVRDVA